ncbi:MAG: LacI family DNA-binding transcriptional regulator [Chloroflexota bacterium]
MRKKTTIDDVAREAGVSRQTVSRAINGMGGISANTRERIMVMVDEMGYEPSRLARGMAGSQTHTIGLVIGDIGNPSHADIFQSLYKLAEAEQYNIMLRNTNYQKELEIKSMKSLTAENVDGIIVLSPTIAPEKLVAFAEPGCPIVVIDQLICAKHVSSIVTDTTRATKSVVEYLIGTGHQTIGLITRPGALDTIRHYVGYKQAVTARNLPDLPQLIVQNETTLLGGYLAAHQLLNQSSNITAITAYNDLQALGAIKACKERGHGVPESISVFGYSDIPFASYSSPTLSTIRINGEEVAFHAFQRIKEMVAQPNMEFPTVVLDIDLVLRESTNKS